MHGSAQFPHCGFRMPTYRGVLARQFDDAFGAMLAAWAAGSLVCAIGTVCLAMGGL